MKGIALSTIALFLIAIVSIVVLISFLGTNLQQALKEFYCSLLKGLSGFLPLPEHMKSPLPSFCRNFKTQKLVYIETSDPDKISFEIASYVLACWETTGKIKVGQDMNCYELVIKRINGLVNEDSVKSNLPDDYKKIMVWEAGEISAPKSIGIFYDSVNRVIKVV